MTAHKEACDSEAGYIHRDISAGNILLYPNADGHFFGLLNDWELSRVFASDEQGDAENHEVYRAVSILPLLHEFSVPDISRLLRGHGNSCLYTAS